MDPSLTYKLLNLRLSLLLWFSLWNAKILNCPFCYQILFLLFKNILIYSYLKCDTELHMFVIPAYIKYQQINHNM